VILSALGHERRRRRPWLEQIACWSALELIESEQLVQLQQWQPHVHHVASGADLELELFEILSLQIGALARGPPRLPSFPLRYLNGEPRLDPALLDDAVDAD
jgi:hypothetical protein